MKLTLGLLFAPMYFIVAGAGFLWHLATEFFQEGRAICREFVDWYLEG